MAKPIKTLELHYPMIQFFDNGSYTMMAKPAKTLELHYPMIQFLINTCYAMLSSGMPWNIPRVILIFSVYKRVFRGRVYQAPVVRRLDNTRY